jgi:hypothetical protein
MRSRWTLCLVPLLLAVFSVSLVYIIMNPIALDSVGNQKRRPIQDWNEFSIRISDVAKLLMINPTTYLATQNLCRATDCSECTLLSTMMSCYSIGISFALRNNPGIMEWVWEFLG